MKSNKININIYRPVQIGKERTKENHLTNRQHHCADETPQNVIGLKMRIQRPKFILFNCSPVIYLFSKSLSIASVYRVCLTDSSKLWLSTDPPQFRGSWLSVLLTGALVSVCVFRLPQICGQPPIFLCLFVLGHRSFVVIENVPQYLEAII